MRNRRKSKVHIKIIFILLAIAIIGLVVKNTFAKYTSTGTSNADVEIALYLFETTKITENLKIDELLPRTEPYTYTISVSNNNGIDRTETALEYDIKIITTTNLPLVYRVYKNEEYTDIGASDIIASNTVLPDENGTFFRTITLPTEQFGFETDEQNIYQIVVEFPIAYNSAEYQNVIDNIEIVIDSRQMMQNP